MVEFQEVDSRRTYHSGEVVTDNLDATSPSLVNILAALRTFLCQGHHHLRLHHTLREPAKWRIVEPSSASVKCALGEAPLVDTEPLSICRCSIFFLVIHLLSYEWLATICIIVTCNGGYSELPSSFLSLNGRQH